jgi:hypothetical protein
MGLGNLNQNHNYNQTSNDPILKQVYQNNEITLFSAIDKSSENMSGSFFVSNNISNSLNNVKINFMVPKYLSLKVLNTAGSNLEPNQNHGIKKVKNNTLYLKLFN